MKGLFLAVMFLFGGFAFADPCTELSYRQCENHRAFCFFQEATQTRSRCKAVFDVPEDMVKENLKAALKGICRIADSWHVETEKEQRCNRQNSYTSGFQGSCVWDPGSYVPEGCFMRDKVFRCSQRAGRQGRHR